MPSYANTSKSKAANPRGRVDARIWNLSENLASSRRRLLISGPSFELIVERLVREMVIVRLVRERLKSDHKYFRASIMVQTTARTVDLFHNSASGYRAQYCISVANGERSNLYVLHALMPRLTTLVSDFGKRTCSPDWVVQSISDRNAKLWIHQGFWLRHAEASDRILRVPRWVSRENASDAEVRKKARWAALIPGAETRIDVKGAYFTLGGEPLGPSKPSRARDIHDLGFT
jgi:hypothetical protein